MIKLFATSSALTSLAQLRYEALHTLETLNQTTISGDSFTEVFLKDQRNLPTRFDSILRFVILPLSEIGKTRLISHVA